MVEYQHLNWDTNFFGYKVAKLLPENITAGKLRGILRSLKEKGYRLVYSFVNPSDEAVNKSHINNKGILVDEKITFSQKLTPQSITIPDHPCIIEYDEKVPDPRLVSIALQCGVFSRFKVDKNFRMSEYNEMYTLWLKNSISKEIADHVFVYRENAKFFGLATAAKSNRLGKIGLIGVDSQDRGKSIGSNLLKHIFNKYFKLGCRRIDVVTQKDNKSACNFYIKNGFSAATVKNVFHFWL